MVYPHLSQPSVSVFKPMCKTGISRWHATNYATMGGGGRRLGKKGRLPFICVFITIFSLSVHAVSEFTFTVCVGIYIHCLCQKNVLQFLPLLLSPGVPAYIKAPHWEHGGVFGGCHRDISVLALSLNPDRYQASNPAV